MSDNQIDYERVVNDQKYRRAVIERLNREATRNPDAPQSPCESSSGPERDG